MANLNSIIQEDKTNVNMSGSNIQPYPLSSTDIAKQEKANLSHTGTQQPAIESNSLDFNTNNVSFSPTEQEKQTEALERQLSVQQNNAQVEAEKQLQEQKTPLTWDTAREDQKLYINSERGGSTFYEFYIPELNKIVNTNTTDEKEINRQIALSQAKTQEERNFIFNSSYFDDKLIIYTGPKNNVALSALKGLGNAVVDVIKGGIQFVAANRAKNRIDNLQRMSDMIVNNDNIDPSVKEALLTSFGINTGYLSLDEGQKQQFWQDSYNKMQEKLSDEAEKICVMPTNSQLKQIDMIRKNIKDPLETLQNNDKKYQEWISKPEIKQYISTQSLDIQKQLEESFAKSPLTTQLEIEGKTNLIKIAQMSEKAKEAVGINYVPELDNPYAYQIGNLGFSYAGQLVALGTGHFELALAFAASQFGDTIDKAVESGLPLDVSVTAANQAALFQYVTEKIQLSLFRMNFASLSKYISTGLANTIAENALQEGIQDLGTKAIEQFYKVDSFSFEDYILDFFINAGIGAIMSVPMGAIVHYQKAKIIQDLQSKNPNMSKETVAELADNILNTGKDFIKSEKGKQLFKQGLEQITRNIANQGIQAKSSDNAEQQNIKNTQDAAFDYLVQPIDKDKKASFIQDMRSAETYTTKYLTEQIGMFDSEAKALSQNFNNLYASLQMTMGISKRQIAEQLLPNVVNTMAISAMNNYANEENKKDYIKFESSIQKTVRKNIGSVDHLTDKDFIDIARDKINGMSEQEISDKYKVTLNEQMYNQLRAQVLIDKLSLSSLKTMLDGLNIKNKELSDALDILISINQENNPDAYYAQLNAFYNLLNKSLGNKGIYGALVGNNNVSNTIKFFNNVLFRKPITGLDIHEIGHFFDIVYYSNQLSSMLGLPTTEFNTKIMSLYNKLGRAITGNKEFVYNPYNMENPEQVKVSEALPNLLAQYMIKGEAKDADTKKLLDYIQSLYKYMNSNDIFYVTQEGNSKEINKAFEEMLKEWNKKQENDIYYQSLEKLNKLIERGDFTNDDIYKIVKDLPLNNGLKLAIYIEKGQNPVITMLQAINDINNTRVDSMYRKAINFNDDLIPSKYMTIPEGDLFEEDFEYGIIQQAKKEWEASDKSLQASRDIYKKYGVYQDEQGSWGYIISDKDMSINIETFKYIKDNLGKLNKFDSKLKLGELIDHKQLFNIDPLLKSLRLVVNSSMEKNNPAALDIRTSRPIININADIFKNDNYDELRTALAHEIQHAIDKSAELKLGGDMFGSIANLIKNDSRFKDVLDFINKGKELKKKNKTGNIDDKEKNTFQDMLSIAEKAFNIYQSDIGEVRARSTENDINKSIEELFDELPPTERRDVKNVVVSNNTNQLVNSLNGVFDNAKEKVLKDYNRHLPQKEQDEEFNLNMTVEEIMSNNLSKTFAVVSEVLKKDSPKLFSHSRRAMYNAMQDMVYYKHQLTELEKSIREMSNEDLYTWEKACLNRDINTMYSLAGRYNFAPELVGMMKSLRELHQIVCSSFEGEQYNQLLGFLQNYWPRLVINHDGLASALAQKDEKFDSSNDTAETHNNKTDKWMDEVQDWIENDLFYKKEKQGSPYFYKERKIKYVDDNLMPFYAKSTDALDNYLNKVQDILFRKYFFGSEYVKAIMNSGPQGKHINMNGIDYVIPNWKQRVKEMGFLTDDPKVNKQILDAIESVFFRGDTSSWNAIYRTATNIMTINSFFSALSNLGDLALTLYNYGFKNTMSAIKDVAVKDAPITSQDLGIVDLYEEFKADGTKLKKIFNWTMKWSGFQYLDRFTKEVNIQAALLSAKEKLQRGGDAEAQLIDKCYMYMGGDEEAANALIANIINNNWTDPDVKLFAFNELSNQQPITKLEVPEYYNRYPQFRSLYLYKTFAVKQLNFAYANIISEIKNNPKEGFKRLIRFMAWLLAVGVTKDIIADMLKGKEINLTDSAMFSISSFFFLNEYNYYTFKSKGAAIGVFHLVMPPIPLLAEISSDVKKIYNGKLKNPMGMQVVKGVPVIGKPFYYWFGN